MAKSKQSDWLEMELSKLVPAEYNPREISDKARSGLNASLDRWGLIQNVVWNKRTGNIVGGHRRVEELLALGKKRGMVKVVDVSLMEEKRMNIALNNPHISGEYTDDLQPLLRESRHDDAALFDSLVLDELLEPDGGGGGDEQPELEKRTFMLSPEQCLVVDEALSFAVEKGLALDPSNQNKGGNALHAVCAGFLVWAQQDMA